MKSGHDDDLDPAEQLAQELRADLMAAGMRPRALPSNAELVDAEQRAFAETMSGGGSEREGSQRTRWRRVAVLAAAAAVVGALVVVDPFSSTTRTAVATTPAVLAFENVKDGDVPRSGEPARDELEALADLADDLPEPADLPNQHVVTEAWWSSTGDDGPGSMASSALVPVRLDSWFREDDTVRAVERRGTPLDDTGRVSTTEGDWVDQPATVDETFDSPDPGAGYVETLSDDPAVLRDQLIVDPSSCTRGVGECLLAELNNLYSNYVVPPRVAAAAWRVLATEESVTSLGATVDRLGREAVAFTAGASSGPTQEIVFADPVTGAYLGSEVILVEPSPDYAFDPPAVLSFSALVSAERTAAAGPPA